MNEHPNIPTLNLSGTPAQIGEAHGEAAREKIKDHTDRFLEFVFSRAVAALDEESLWSKWSPQVSANERSAPDLVEEMRGIARGSGVSFERIFLLNQDFLFGRPGAYTIADYRLRCNGFRTAARFGTPFAAAPAFACWPIMAFQRSQRAL